MAARTSTLSQAEGCHQCSAEMPAGQRLAQMQRHVVGVGVVAGDASSTCTACSTSAEQKWLPLYQRAATTAGYTTVSMDPGSLVEPTGLAVLADGTLAVTDCSTNRLYLVDPLTGSTIVQSSDCDFDRPYSVIAVPTAVTATVVVEQYDPHWAERFRRIQRSAVAALEGVTTRVEHVGSTSVPGLAAKPIIDVDAVVANASQVQEAIAALRPLGYEHQGEKGIAGRHAFRYAGPSDGGGQRNFYVCLDGSDSLLNHVALRDYLRSHPSAAAEYSAAKLENARKYARDIDGYVEAKTGVIVQFLAAAGFDPSALSAIVEANTQTTPAAAPEVAPADAERLLVTDRNHHRLVEVDPADACKFVRAVGRQGAGLGEYRGPRSIALLQLGSEKRHGGLGRPLLAVVENENDRIQLLRWDQTVMATVDLEDGRSGKAMTLKGAGGCVAVSSIWRQADGRGLPPQLLAVADSYNHRVLVVEIHLPSSSDGTATGKVLWEFSGVAVGGSSDDISTGLSSFAVPTCVCEPRPGLLAVTDRDNGRLVLLELPLAPNFESSQVVSREVAMAFVAPVGCCALPGGGVAVTDTGNHRVVVLSPRALT